MLAPAERPRSSCSEALFLFHLVKALVMHSKHTLKHVLLWSLSSRVIPLKIDTNGDRSAL